MILSEWNNEISFMIIIHKYDLIFDNLMAKDRGFNALEIGKLG